MNMISTAQEVLQALLANADFVVGSDEVGYGCYAGPLVVCAVIIPKNWPLASEVMDSKAFTGVHKEVNRQNAAKKILPHLTYAMVSTPVEQIDAKGVYKCLHEAHSKAITGVLAKHDQQGRAGNVEVVVDGILKIPYERAGATVPAAHSLPKADALVPAVSAASIIAKVARDSLMVKLDSQFPGYGFKTHKGYGTKAHEQALRDLGPCPIHRMSYAPIRELLQTRDLPAGLSALDDGDAEP